MKGPRLLDKTLGWFANVWMALILLITIVTFARIIWEAPSFWGAVSAVIAEIFNYQLYTTIALFSVPAIGALWWKEKRQSKRNSVAASDN